ncbi:MAG: CARDB domain-containing protein, partial [Acidimicrobiales bacterium]
AADDLTGTPASPTQIHFAIWNGSGFAASALLPAGVQPDGLSSLAFDGTKAIFTWISDEDDSILTSDDRALYWSEFDGSAWSAPVRATNDLLLDREPRVFCLANGSFELVWVKGVDLVRMASFTSRTHDVIRSSAPVAAPPQYDVACDSLGRIALLWTDVDEGQVDLRYAVLDSNNGVWSNELLLTRDESVEKSPTFGLSSGGELIAAFLRQAPDSELHDLLWLESPLGRDLTVGPITVVSTGNPDEFQITAELRNLGDLTAENFNADFYLGDPDSGGTLLGSIPNMFLNGGNTSDQSIVTSGLAPGADGVVYVRIDPANAVAELDETNNIGTTALNPVDLAAENLLWELSPDGTLLTLTGFVRNNGRTTQTDILVEIHGEQGLLLTALIPSLPSGSAVEVPGVLATASAFPTDDNLFALKADPADTLGEPDRTNNEYTLPLTLREPATFTLPDSDGDGIDDSWELTHFGNLERDGTGDSDGDGLTDLFESLALTDPLDANSEFLSFVDPDPSSLADFLITFPTNLGKSYRIQRSSDLMIWTDYSLYAGTGATVVVPVAGISNTGQTGSHASFFQIQIEAN